MSIIYDALKKVEEASSKNLGTEMDKSSKSMPKKIAYHKKIPKILISVLVVCLGVFVANIFFGIFPKPLSNNTYTGIKDQPGVDKKQDVSVHPGLPKETPLEVKPSVKESPPSFVLNGVFFSGDEGYALINNRIVKKGDKIDGATVVAISLDEVNLEAEGSIIKLSNNPR